MAVTHLTDQNFDAHITQASGLVLVDFWAPWCGPCKMLHPILEELAQELSENAQICMVNIDESPEAPTRHGVRSIPTLLLFKDGKVVDTKVGMSSKSALLSWIQSHQ